MHDHSIPILSGVIQLYTQCEGHHFHELQQDVFEFLMKFLSGDQFDEMAAVIQTRHVNEWLRRWDEKAVGSISLRGLHMLEMLKELYKRVSHRRIASLRRHDVYR